MNDLEKLISDQVEAYRNRDLEKFCSFYSDEVEIYKLPEMDCIVKGKDQLRSVYRERFLNKFTIEITRRISTTDSVVDHEKITMKDGSIKEVVVKYQIRNSLITKVFIA